MTVTVDAPAAAGPAPDDGRPINLPPGLSTPRWLQTLRFGLRPLGFSARTERELGEVFRIRLLSREEHFVSTSP